MTGIGALSEPLVAELERGAIRKFATALGETDPVFFDVEAARSRGYRDLLAPPTFAATLGSNPVPDVALPPAGNIHGEQEFVFNSPMFAGDKISVVRGLVNIRERDGGSGKMQIYTFEIRGTAQDGNLVFTARQVIIVRLTTEPIA